MQQTKITFEQAKQTGSDIQAIASEIKSILANVSTEMEKVDGEAWQSANATKFKNDFEMLSQTFVKVHDAIDTMGQAINASGTMYETAEKM